jgi:NAD+ synthase (glutamine-hydrolysing)
LAVTRLRLVLCQLNLAVGDIDGNADRIIAALSRAETSDADIAIFPELAVTGYPPEDLLLKPRFVADNLAAVDKIAAHTGTCSAIFGFAQPTETGLTNAAAVCAGGQIIGVTAKVELPTYGVFDEDRWFQPGAVGDVFQVGDAKIGVTICEDLWTERGPIAELAARGADLIVNINASPFHSGKYDERVEVLEARTSEAAVPIAYLNLVGGQDEILFDGASVVVAADGELLARAPQFKEAEMLVDIELGSDIQTAATELAPLLDADAAVYEGLVLGTRDYVTKNGFSDICLGLSGGIDSTLVATVAADALGPEHVHAVLMPSRYSSAHSVDDAVELSQNLGIDHRIIPIDPGHVAFEGMLQPSFTGIAPDLTEENVQSRIRGVLLMALSNKFGWLVLTTGNKSESAVGYSTLYGDTAGAFAVIKDLWKLRVYDLVRYRNRLGDDPVVPQHILEKPPSAELRPDQRDDQSLPPYEILDPLLMAIVEGDQTPAEIVAAGADFDLVHRIARLVDVAEYKRRQTPPGIRVTKKAFGRDRRLPITNLYRGEATP